MSLDLFVFVMLLRCVTSIGDCENSRPRPKRPHIIFFLVDDLGWNDVGFHGMTQIPTPNIDALAADGVILNNYYVCPMCTPSRAALLSGRYPSNTGMQHFILPESGPWGLPLSLTLLPDSLNKLGYVSRMVGKWHLGFFKSEYLPTSRGFKSHYGFWGGSSDFFNFTTECAAIRGDYFNVPDWDFRPIIGLTGHSFRENMKSVMNRQGEYLTDLYTERAVNILKKHRKNKPLFLYLSHHSVHRGQNTDGILAPENYTKDFNYITNSVRRQFAGSLTAVDQSLGTIMKTLYDEKMLEDTILVFSTDNGVDQFLSTTNGGSNWPLRGQKFTQWEGGVRGTAVIWSPLLKKSRKVWDGLMHITDWYPTLYSAAGGMPKNLGVLDGVDLWKAISENLESPRSEVLLIQDNIWNMNALRLREFKLITGSSSGSDHLNVWGGDPGRQKPPSRIKQIMRSQVINTLEAFYKDVAKKPPTKFPVIEVRCGQQPKNDSASSKCDLQKELCLFDLRKDPCEYNNIARSNTKMVELMLGRLEFYNRTSVDSLYQKKDYYSDPNYYNGFWVPWKDKAHDEPLLELFALRNVLFNKTLLL